jgi:hypothetical protein
LNRLAPAHCHAAVKTVDLSRLRPGEIKGMVREISVFQPVGHSLLLFMEFAPGGTLIELAEENAGGEA